MQKIYFSTAPLIISATPVPNLDGQHINSTDKKVINAALTNANRPILLIQPDEEKAINAIKNQFIVIQAAGGLAYTPEQEVLLIFRRGKWDLPKGKLDAGESLETCAVREVEEETGLKKVALKELILKTYHTYQEKGNDILKETFWYYMQTQKQDLHPQTDEDIEECRWVAKQDISNYFSNMQPSVKDVLDAYLALPGH